MYPEPVVSGFEPHREDEGHTVRPLGRLRCLPVAAPEFTDRHPTGVLPEPLPAAPAVVFGREDDFQDGFVRRLGRAPRARCATTCPSPRGSPTR
ncbi:hypothetical protein [Streptomyces monashensis]|uniref:Uncharacterized protein n=1 Tax=Streptomyces monashensis TaxID=1678012 RepID=A0A1S2PKK8_9ACTN|nr:hypothetical protein BIV23_36240 [Streptomyces monashensis]